MNMYDIFIWDIRYDLLVAAKKTPAARGGRRKGAGRKPVLKSAVRMSAHVEKSVLAGLKSG